MARNRLDRPHPSGYNRRRFFGKSDSSKGLCGHCSAGRLVRRLIANSRLAQNGANGLSSGSGRVKRKKALDLRRPWLEYASGHVIDPLGFDAGDSNLYRYVKNRPLLNLDPSGQFVQISGSRLTPDEATAIAAKFFEGNVVERAKRIAKEMATQMGITASYPTVEDFAFDLKVRTAIHFAAFKLLSQHHRFSMSGKDVFFVKNLTNWETFEGDKKRQSSRIRSGKSPFEGIQELFATAKKDDNDIRYDCNTAILLIYFKATADLIGRANFDKAFAGLTGCPA